MARIAVPSRTLGLCIDRDVSFCNAPPSRSSPPASREWFRIRAARASRKLQLTLLNVATGVTTVANDRRLWQLSLRQSRSGELQDHCGSRRLFEGRGRRHAAHGTESERSDLSQGRLRQRIGGGHHRSPDRRHGRQPDSTDPREPGCCGVADRRPQPGHARDHGARRFRPGNQHVGKSGFGRRQLLDGRAGGRQRQRAGPEQQSVRHRRTRRHQRNPSGRVEPHPAARIHPGNERAGEYVFGASTAAPPVCRRSSPPDRAPISSTVPRRTGSTTRECSPISTS